MQSHNLIDPVEIDLCPQELGRILKTSPLLAVIWAGLAGLKLHNKPPRRKLPVRGQTGVLGMAFGKSRVWADNRIRQHGAPTEINAFRRWIIDWESGGRKRHTAAKTALWKKTPDEKKKDYLKRLEKQRNDPAFKAKRNAAALACRNRNREHYRTAHREYERKRLATDPEYKLSKYLRKRLRTILIEAKSPKFESALKLCGCSITELKEHIRGQFKRGMRWSNYGRWHIDHIIPVSKFNLMDPIEQKKCFHYLNLQPLWGTKNIAKGGRITEPSQLSLCLPA
jgi:hypothetical protein